MAQEEARHSHISVIPGDATIEGGETILLAVRQQMEDGWHTYWINAGDSGEPMRMDWSLPAGFSTGEAQWPVPKRIITGPLASYGYEHEAIILVPLTAPETIVDGPVIVKLATTTLVCADICIPESQELTVTLNTPETVADAELVTAAQGRMPVKQDVQGTFREEDGYLYVTMDAEVGEGPVLLPHDWGLIDNMATTEESEGGVRHKRGDRPLRTMKEARFLLADASGKGVEFVAQSPYAQTPVVPAAVDTAPADDMSKATDISLAWALLLAFGGGLILNLMPCVFPVLFMKALSLCKLSGKEESEARLQALLYTAGILVSFAAVAGILMALRAGGAQIGWGFQLQQPVVIAALSTLFFVIALNLSGFFEISGRFAGAGQGLLEKGGKHGHAFFMGVLATIVATPCTAPFMGAAMGYALVQPPVQAMAVFLMLGLGMAAPYVALSYIPALRRMLPKPGTWMEVFRRVLAVPMFLTVAYLVWVFSRQAGIVPVGVMIGGFVVLAAVIKMWGRTSGSIGRAALLVLALFAVTAPVTASRLVPVPVQDAHAAEEGGFTPERLAAALAGDRPVLVNMTAAWCITCKVSEKVALTTADTKALFTEMNVDYIVGDWTNQDPAISKYLESYGRNGVPLYVFYGKPVDGQRPAPVVLPQLLTPGIIAKTIKGEN